MRKVALVGFAQSSIQTEWQPDVEIWTINCAWRYGFDRITRLFEMHKVDQLTSYLGKETEWENEHWAWLQKITDYPVYMLAKDDRIPASVAYPIDEVCADVFANLDRESVQVRYLTSSASFLLALAIHEKVDEIYLAGFEMTTGSEYTYQRDGMTYLIGVATGRGIKVHLSSKSNLMKAKIYAYEGGQTVDRAEVGAHFDNYIQQRNIVAKAHEEKPNGDDYAMVFRTDGAAQALNHMLSLSDGAFFGRQTLEAHHHNYQGQLSDAVGFVNRYNAQLEEADDAVKKNPNKQNKRRRQDNSARLEKAYRTMLVCEGAIQAMSNLILVCDLQEPNMKIRPLARTVEEKTK